MPSYGAPALVFINHRTGDEPFAVAALHSELSRRYGDHTVFLDRVSLLPGAEFSQGLLSAVRQCSVMLVVIGSNWIMAAGGDGQRLLDRKGDWVRKEIAAALRAGVTVVPVLVNETPRLEPRTLPSGIRRLASLQAVRLRHDELRRDLDSLIGRLELVEPRLVELTVTT